MTEARKPGLMETPRTPGEKAAYGELAKWAGLAKGARRRYYRAVEEGGDPAARERLLDEWFTAARRALFVERDWYRLRDRLDCE